MLPRIAFCEDQPAERNCFSILWSWSTSYEVLRYPSQIAHRPCWSASSLLYSSSVMKYVFIRWVLRAKSRDCLRLHVEHTVPRSPLKNFKALLRLHLAHALRLIAIMLP